MGKIFDVRNGSYINRVDNAVGVANDATWIRSDKGLAIVANGVSSGVTYPASYSAINCTVGFGVKIPNSVLNDGANADIIGVGASSDRIYFAGFNLYMEIGNGNTFVLATNFDVYRGEWIYIHVVKEGTDAWVYVNGVLFDTSSQATGGGALVFSKIYGRTNGARIYENWQMSEVTVWDEVISVKERNKSYADFLRAGLTGRAVKDNLDYPALKPHDLSHLVDSRIGNPDARKSSLLDEGKGVFTSDTETWIKYSANLMTNDNGALKIEYVDNTNGAYVFFKDDADLDSDLVIGNYYTVDVRYKAIGSFDFQAHGQTDGTIDTLSVTTTDWTTHRFLFKAGTTSTCLLRPTTMGAGDIFWLDYYIIKEWNGEELVPDNNEEVGFIANRASKWAATGTNTLRQVGNAVECTFVDADNGMQMFFTEALGTMFNNPVAGDKIRFTCRVKVNQGTIYLRIADDSGGDWITTTFTETEFTIINYDYTVLDDNLYFRFDSLGAGEIVTIEILSMMKVTGLVAAYNMIPNGDTLVDISGEGQYGTLLDDVVTSKEGLYFGRTNGGRVGIGGSDTFLPKTRSNFSISFRFKPGNFSGSDQYLFILDAGGSTWRNTMIIYNPGYIRHSFYDGVFNTSPKQSSITVQSEQWYNCTITYDPTNDITHIYVNGVDVTSTGGNESTSGGSWIGAQGTAGGNGLKGTIADVKIFNYILSEREAIDYHNQFAKEVKHKDRLALDFGVGDSI